MRQILLMCIALVSVVPVSSAEQTDNRQDWHFQVFLDDQAIGHHTFSLSRIGASTQVAVDAKFNVKFLFITAYSYQHQNYEVWRDNCLYSIHSQTDDNGDAQYVNGQKTGTTFQIQTAAGQNRVEGCLKTFAYWDASFLQSRQLLNAQTGEVMSIEVQPLGIVELLIQQQRVPAKQYRLVTDKFSIDLWYAVDNNDWLALKSTTRDGTVLRYQKVAEVKS